MTTNVAAFRSVTSAIPSDLSGRLKYLQGFGLPRVFCYEDGTWSVGVKMHVASAGAQFEICSDRDCESVDAAMDQLITRLRDTMAKLGVQL